MNVKYLDFYPKVGGGLSTKCIRFFKRFSRDVGLCEARVTTSMVLFAHLPLIFDIFIAG